MRSAGQITRTVGEWRDHGQAERQLHLRELMRLLEQARRDGAEWYLWVLNGRPTLTEAEYASVRKK